MPIRRKLEEAVPILLRLVDEVSKVSDPKTQQHLDILDELKNIKRHFLDEKTEDLFRHLKETEDGLLKNFTTLEEKIDDSKYTGNDGSQSSIKDEFKRIKDVVSEFEKLELKNIEKSRKNDESGADQAKEISEQWSALKVERHILESSVSVNSVLDPFQLSYDNIIDHKYYTDGKERKENTIPGHNIKLCLLCFSVFPAKSVIKKRPLIYWWLGEGLITDMDHGERIFGELIKKGFLIARYKPYKKEEQDKNPIVDSCTMHSWIRRMLISVAKRAEFFDFDDDTGLPANHGTNSRHMCLVKQRYLDKQTPPNGEPANQDHIKQGQGQQQQQHQQQKQNMGPSTEHRLLTLFNVNEQYLNIRNIEGFSEENKIVVLQLGRWQDSAEHHIEVENEDFLKALGTKKHLKYLSLRGISRITEIPSSFRKLINLEILDLRACHNLEKLPSDISSLKKLTHLDISECHLLESMPKGLEKLTSLQVFKGFVVATSKKSPYKLENLAKLEHLRKLSIYIRNEDYMEELSKLKQFSTLRILSITWGERGVEGSKEQSRKQDPIPKNIPFPPNLKKLDLWCIPETKPAWLDPDGLQSLSKLYIRGGKLQSFNEGRSNKWRVQILRLKYLHDFEDGIQLRQHFPYLIYLETENKGKDKHGASSSRS